jgi:DNA invertase Pin-like site-specific DNA recombinase
MNRELKVMFLSIKERLEMRMKGLEVPDLVIRKAPIRQKQNLGIGYIPPKKFDEETANTIRSLYSSQKNSYSTLAIEFGTCKATIEHVIRGKGAYKDLNGSSNFTTNW